VVEPAVEGHQRLGPQAAHDLDLLLQPVLAGGEVGARPSYSAQLQPTPTASRRRPAEQVDGGHLLGHQCGRPLWEHEHARDQLHALGDGGEVSERDEDLVERVLVGVRRRREGADTVGVVLPDAPRTWS
jgi:hypothetical protein